MNFVFLKIIWFSDQDSNLILLCSFYIHRNLAWLGFALRLVFIIASSANEPTLCSLLYSFHIHNTQARPNLTDFIIFHRIFSNSHSLNWAGNVLHENLPNRPTVHSQQHITKIFLLCMTLPRIIVGSSDNYWEAKSCAVSFSSKSRLIQANVNNRLVHPCPCSLPLHSIPSSHDTHRLNANAM